MKRIKLILIVSLVLGFVFGCKKSRMKWHKQNIERVKPINEEREILWKGDTAIVVITKEYDSLSFVKMGETRKRDWRKKGKRKPKNKIN